MTSPVAWRWFRWRDRWSWGQGEWEFVELYTASEKDARNALGEDRATSWSEHWRGVDVEEIDAPPVQFLANKIKETGHRITGLTQAHERYKRLLATLEGSKSDG